MARYKDEKWQLSDPVPDTTTAALAVLMDLRDELKALNRVFACPNFVVVPEILRQIRRNTAKPRKRKTRR